MYFLLLSFAINKSKKQNRKQHKSQNKSDFITGYDGIDDLTLLISLYIYLYFCKKIDDRTVTVRSAERRQVNVHVLLIIFKYSNIINIIIKYDYY